MTERDDAFTAIYDAMLAVPDVYDRTVPFAVCAHAALEALRSLPVEQRMEAMGMEQVQGPNGPYWLDYEYGPSSMPRRIGKYVPIFVEAKQVTERECPARDGDDRCARGSRHGGWHAVVYGNYRAKAWSDAAEDMDDAFVHISEALLDAQREANR